MQPSEEQADSQHETSSTSHATLVAVVAAVSGFTFWRYVATYPPTWPQLALNAPFEFDVRAAASLGSAFLFVAALNLAAWQLGAWVRRGLGDKETGRLTALAQLAYGLMILPYLVLGLAACHLLQPPFLVSLIALPAAISLPDLWRRSTALWRRHRDSPSPLPPPLPSPSHETKWPWLGLVLAIVLVAGPLLSALGPEVGWDADVYHLAIPERYLFHNGIYSSQFSLFTAFPSHMEMFYVLALGLSGEIAAKLVHFEFGVLLFVLVYIMAASESRRCAVLALLFLASEPLLYREMAWAYNDLVAPFYALLAFASLHAWIQAGNRAQILRAGIFVGVCVATRYTGGAVLIALLGALWLVPTGTSAHKRVRASLWLAGLAGIALLPWLVRNAAFTGNPVAPTLQSLFHAPGREFFSPLAVRQTLAFHEAIGMGRDFWALLKLPWNLTVGSAPGSYSNSFGFQLSPLHAIGFMSAVAAALLRRRSDIARVLVAIVVFVLLWFPLFQEARFLLPVAGFLALVGGWAFDVLLPRRVGPGSVLWVFPVAAAALAGSIQLDGLGPRFARAVDSGSRVSAQQRFAAPAAAAALREAVATRTDVRIFVVAESRSYLFRGLDYVPYAVLEAPPTLDWIRSHADVSALYAGLRDMGITHIFANFNNFKDPRRPQAIPEYDRDDFLADAQRVLDLMNRRGRSIYNRGGIGIVQLEPAANRPAEIE